MQNINILEKDKKEAPRPFVPRNDEKWVGAYCEDVIPAGRMSIWRIDIVCQFGDGTPSQFDVYFCKGSQFGEFIIFKTFWRG